jgi:hypothetical protein
MPSCVRSVIAAIFIYAASTLVLLHFWSAPKPEESTELVYLGYEAIFLLMISFPFADEFIQPKATYYSSCGINLSFKNLSLGYVRIQKTGSKTFNQFLSTFIQPAMFCTSKPNNVT